MKKLYKVKTSFGYTYVVALNYAKAEAEFKDKQEEWAEIEQIELISNQVMISK